MASNTRGCATLELGLVSETLYTYIYIERERDKECMFTSFRAG